MTFADFDSFASKLEIEAQQATRQPETMAIMETVMSIQDTEVETGPTVLKIPVPKAKTFVECEPDRLPDWVYQACLIEGIKSFVSRGMTKFTKEMYPEDDERQGIALEKAKENLQSLYDGKLVIRGAAKADKVPREVTTEARRIARALVKAQLKAAGVKISYVEASEITKAANALLAADPEILAQAQEEVQKNQKRKVAIDVAAMVPISEKKKKAAEAKKATKTLTAAQAGKVATRGRPTA